MKRQNLIITLIAAIALMACTAIAKEIPGSEPQEECIPQLWQWPGTKTDPTFTPNEQYIPGLTTLPDTKVEPTTPNEEYNPGLVTNPGAITPYGAPTAEVPIPEAEKAPMQLQPQPTQPQLAPAPPPRGVTPIPPPQQGPGNGWNDRKPRVWMWLIKLFEPGE